MRALALACFLGSVAACSRSTNDAGDAKDASQAEAGDPCAGGILCERFDDDAAAIAQRWEAKVEDPALPLTVDGAVSVAGTLAQDGVRSSYLPRRFARGLEKIDCELSMQLDSWEGEADFFSIYVESDVFRYWIAAIGASEAKLAVAIRTSSLGGGAEIGETRVATAPPAGAPFKLRFELALTSSGSSLRVTAGENGPATEATGPYAGSPRAFAIRIGLPQAKGSAAAPVAYGVRLDDIVCRAQP